MEKLQRWDREFYDQFLSFINMLYYYMILITVHKATEFINYSPYFPRSP